MRLSQNIDSGVFSCYITAKYLFKHAGPRGNCEISEDYVWSPLHPFSHHITLIEACEKDKQGPTWRPNFWTGAWNTDHQIQTQSLFSLAI